MKDSTKVAIKEWLENNEDERVEICRQINCYNGSMDEFDTWEDLETYATDSGVEPAELAREIFFGDVTSWDDPVRLNVYGNLETVTDADLVSISEDYISDIIDTIEDDGFQYISNSDLEELYDELEEE